MKENRLKQKIQSGQPALGCFTRCMDLDMTELLCMQGFDFLVFDGEHGTLEPRDCQFMTRCTELHQVTSIMRIPTNQQLIIPKFMDTGVQGLLMPLVNSVDHAETVVRWAKFPPIGQRGLAGSRAAEYGQRMPLEEYTRFANENIFVVVQIETVAAMDALPDILKVKGVDAVFVGPTDLSQSLGVTGQLQHPKMQQALDQIAKQVSDSDKALGLMVTGSEMAEQWIERGAQLLSVTLESRIKEGCEAFLKPMKI